MKKTLLIYAALMLANAAFSQGTVVNANRAVGIVVAPIYAAEPSDNTRRITGNTADTTHAFPVGNQSYGGGFLYADGVHTWRTELWGIEASLWSGSSNSTDNSLIFLGANANSTMRTNQTGNFAGIWNTPSGNPSVPGAALPSSRAYFQVRVWDTKNGAIADWATLTRPENNGVFRGFSDAFFLDKQLGLTAQPPDPPNTPPNLVGLQSFNVFIVPEPSVIALGVLGAGCLFLLRRRK